nr:DUF2752 domain-containing protein [Clostridia bacterium]
MRTKRIIGAALIAFAAVFCIFLAASSGTVCPTSALLGIPCPFCGLTRAALFAVNGDYAASFAANPMLVPVLLGILVVCDFVRRELDGLKRSRFHAVYMILLLISVTAVYIVRMCRGTLI